MTLGYVESTLLPDEQIVYMSRLHGKIFLPAAAIIALGVGLLFLETTVAEVVIAVGLVFGLRALIKHKTSEFAVTTKRVIIKTGVFRRRTLELLLRQVEAISVDQTLLGRILDYGTVTLTGTGGVHEVFHDIASPLEFRRQIHAQAV